MFIFFWDFPTLPYAQIKYFEMIWHVDIIVHSSMLDSDGVFINGKLALQRYVSVFAICMFKIFMSDALL